MKSTSATERERRRLASVASEYEQRGYEVKLQPAAGDLPEFLAGFEPDLIATGNGESVVVEVKARKEFENEYAVAALAKLEAALRNCPGWRFELIIDGSESEDERLLGAPQIETSLEEANELQQRGHLIAALLLLWSATEGILRLLAARENVELGSPVAGYMTKRLYTLGLLASFWRKTYKLLISQENGSVQDQTIDKPGRRSGCGFRRDVGRASRTARHSRSGLVGGLRPGVSAPSYPTGS